MVSLPAAAWRGGRWYRGFFAGVPIGLFFGALAWLDSGMLISGAIVAVVLGAAFGFWMSRHMGRYWPGADALDPADRVAVVRAARRGDPIDEPRLARSVIEYQRALHTAVDDAGHLRIRWVLWLILAVAAGMALYDSLFGSVRDVIASIVYLGLLAFEFVGWPAVRDRVLANADRAAA